MEQKINEQVETIVAGIRPSLGGADVRLKDVSQGIVTLEYHKPLSNPLACHVDKARITKEIIIELLQDELKVIIPDFKKINILGEE